MWMFALNLHKNWKHFLVSEDKICFLCPCFSFEIKINIFSIFLPPIVHGPRLGSVSMWVDEDWVFRVGCNELYGLLCFETPLRRQITLTWRFSGTAKSQWKSWNAYFGVDALQLEFWNHCGCKCLLCGTMKSFDCPTSFKPTIHNILSREKDICSIWLTGYCASSDQSKGVHISWDPSHWCVLVLCACICERKNQTQGESLFWDKANILQVETEKPFHLCFFTWTELAILNQTAKVHQKKWTHLLKILPKPCAGNQFVTIGTSYFSQKENSAAVDVAFAILYDKQSICSCIPMCVLLRVAIDFLSQLSLNCICCETLIKQTSILNIKWPIFILCTESDWLFSCKM